MSGGVLPPVPDLIPIAALEQGCSMGEQRPRRRAAELIDTVAAGSRAASAAPPSLPRSSRAATRPGQRRRRRKSVRKPDTDRSVGKQGGQSNSPDLEKPPRVNPIFVWVRQEDTRIVDVKCEDYDKRNRILLTKTAHGWKAIPRTETSIKPSSNEDESNANHHNHHHHHHHRKRVHKHKSRRKSVSLQFPENLESLDNPDLVSNTTQAPWMHPENVNIESLLPSHTIPIKRKPSVDGSVNRDGGDLGHALAKCNASDKVCDVSPLENLLAVAELEFKQQMESGVWKNDSDNVICEKTITNEICPKILEKIDNSELYEDDKSKSLHETNKLIDDMKIVECDDYNEDDEGIAMTDILSRLEKSLQSPENEELDTGESREDTVTIENVNPVLENQVMCDPEAPLQETNDDETVQKEEVVDSNVLKITEPKEIDAVTPEIVKPNEFLDKSTCKEVIQESTELSIKTKEIPIITLEQPLETALETTEVVDENKHYKTPCLLESLKAPVISVECITEVEEIPLIESKNNKCVDDVKEDINQSNLNKLEEENAVTPTKKTNILEILSKEVEKIEPIGPKTILPLNIVQPQPLEKNEIEPQPLDFSIKNKTTILTINTDIDDSLEGPTDLTVRKSDNNLQDREKRPRSQSSDAIQSPQPSGIPAVLHSPDTVSTSSTPKNKSAFLDSLLANVTNKAAFNSDLTVTKHSEPKDIENRRKSASPTVTCSEEIVNKPVSDMEPPSKKFKPDDITLKQLLDKEEENLKNVVKSTTQEPRSTSTPALLELLKDAPERTDPLTDFKKLLLEVDIPEPLMVPKTRFVNLLKNPREEIFNLMRDKSYKNLRIDDILVVYKDKLFAALEANAKLEKTISESKPNQVLERRSSHGDKTNLNKRKGSDSIPKNISPESTVKNISASDIDAATEAAFSQMMMFPYQSQLEAMSWASSQQELLQTLYGTNPFLPGQAGEINPNLQMMFGNNRIPPLSPLGFSSLPPMNFTNPLEFSMWQEAMMQANLLRNKSAFENSILNQPLREFKSQIPTRRFSTHGSQLHSCSSKNQNSTNKSSSSQEQQNLLQKLYEQNSLSNQQVYQNPYLGQASYQQKTTSPLNVPQYNPYQHGRNHSSRIMYPQEKEQNSLETYREHQKKVHQQKILLERQRAQQKQQQERTQKEHRLQERLQKPMPKPCSSAIKPILHNSFALPKSVLHPEPQTNETTTRQLGYQPIDLSGSQILTAGGKYGAANINQKTEKSYASSTTSKTHDDVAEVGSTTASIEEMQDANTHLWHPFFGSDKGYTPWSMSSVTDSE